MSTRKVRFIKNQLVGIVCDSLQENGGRRIQYLGESYLSYAPSCKFLRDVYPLAASERQGVTLGVVMASPVNRKRRRKAFSRGFDRPQGMNPYKNAVLAKLWNLGRERRLAKTGGIMPLPPRRDES